MKERLSLPVAHTQNPDIALRWAADFKEREELPVGGPRRQILRTVARGGVAARSTKAPRSDLFSAQTGAKRERDRAKPKEWSVRRESSDFAGRLLRLRPIGLALRATRPLRKDAAQYFIDVASTPPLRGGECSLARIGKIETESLLSSVIIWREYDLSEKMEKNLRVHSVLGQGNVQSVFHVQNRFGFEGSNSFHGFDLGSVR